ncbi:MAG: hypothetical protein LGR52_08210 [Candidatus Thiosymbion ectosymbiont of Robbea hypermnestra]|nr:hypothetical protein [Candidatus Thiosymbion ectosymbiont of Robbea hypermnestra]
MENDTRKTLLTQLLVLSLPIETTLKALARFGWDSDQELSILKLDHIEDVLRRYLAGQLTANLVETWADAIEGREDIGMEERDEDFLREVIFELANPVLHRSLSEGYARSILSRLHQARLDTRPESE